MSVLEELAEDERRQLRAEESPMWVEPMLATLTENYFSDSDWVFERKLDGVRALAFRSGARVRLRSRNDNDLGGSFPEIVEALGSNQSRTSDFAIDGEVVAFAGAVTSFARLQRRLHRDAVNEAIGTRTPVYYYAFDVLHVDGYDVTRLPLRRRKALLRRLLPWQDPLRYTAHRNGDGEAFRKEACGKGWEGVIAKRASASYRHARSTDWLKFKCAKGQELVIGGYTDPKGSRHDFGALLVGYHENGQLVYAGKVGTGFDDATLRNVGSRLRAREQTTPPFDRGDLPKHDVHWVTPDLVCEVGFTEWTRDGSLRHPRFRGLRHDKDASEVVREEPRSLSS
jgi:DNA ligase D-like protein (predicted ligase)